MLFGFLKFDIMWNFILYFFCVCNRWVLGIIYFKGEVIIFYVFKLVDLVFYKDNNIWSK